MNKIFLLMMCSFISLSSASFSMNVEEEPARKRVFSSAPDTEIQEYREFTDCSVIVYNIDVPLVMNGSPTGVTIGFTPEQYSDDWDKYNRSFSISLPSQGQSCDARLKPGPYKVRLSASFTSVNSFEGFY